MDQQRRLAQIVMGEQTDYEGGANPRDRLSDLGNVYDIGAPLQAHLHYHHEMTYKSHSVESIGFLCKHAVTQRPGVGWSYVSDSVQAHHAIMQTELGHKLKDKGLCFIRRLTDADAYNDLGGGGGAAGAVYNHWQKSWMTEDPLEAQQVAEAQGLQIRWIPDPNMPGRAKMMETRYYKSAFEYIPTLDRNILITSIADDGEWFDSWGEISRIPQAQRPMDTTFGDDTPISYQEKQLWTDCYDNFGIPIAWSPGDVAVLCNMRFAHGRPGIELLPGEKRELGVMLGRLFERQETKEGKW
jgi:Taurine catabolism dioxygenase TauD, TfdA family